MFNYTFVSIDWSHLTFFSFTTFDSTIETAKVMARTKQATPLRREPSSEYFSKNEGGGTPSRSPRNLDKEKERSNGHAILNGDLVKPVPLPEVKEAGALQLVFAVGGIYGSL